MRGAGGGWLVTEAGAEVRDQGTWRQAEAGGDSEEEECGRASWAEGVGLGQGSLRAGAWLGEGAV